MGGRLARWEGGTWIFVQPQVPSYATADGAGLLLSQGRFEEPVRSCPLSL